MRLTTEKLRQATALVAASEVDVWMTFDQETADGGDPVLPLLIEGALTWQSALIVSKSGRRVAIVGNYDADPLRASGDWDEVVPYVESVREPLLATLGDLIPATQTAPKIGVNYSTNDVKADGLSHGMYLLLESYLSGTRFAGSLVSAEEIVIALRSQKTPTERAHIQEAIVETERLLTEAAGYARITRSEFEIYEYVQEHIVGRGLGFAWDRAGDPIVNTGPNSMIGHGIPSPKIRVEAGHIFHIDLGVTKHGYSSDIQRCWYVPDASETTVPDDVRQATAAVVGAISAGAAALRPGVEGWQVDVAAREFLVAAGYPEYKHALGHQVGRVAHDGGALLGPKWERYGRTPTMLVQENQIYTLELGVSVPGRGYLGIEEMVRITASGCEWLTTRQREMPLLPEENAAFGPIRR
jgi:Xaa-Pro aminopeptidase